MVFKVALVHIEAEKRWVKYKQMIYKIGVFTSIYIWGLNSKLALINHAFSWNFKLQALIILSTILS
jgi:hypothetical protein